MPRSALMSVERDQLIDEVVRTLTEKMGKAPDPVIGAQDGRWVKAYVTACGDRYTLHYWVMGTGRFVPIRGRTVRECVLTMLRRRPQFAFLAEDPIGS